LNERPILVLRVLTRLKELRVMHTPTPADVAFVATHARGPAQKFALMILLKVINAWHKRVEAVAIIR
jgi:hypothetical protein